MDLKRRLSNEFLSNWIVYGGSYFVYEPSIPVDERLVKSQSDLVNRRTLENNVYRESFMENLVAIINDSSTHWKSRILAMNAIRILLVPDSKISATFIQTIVKASVDEHPELRREAQNVLRRLLIIVKIKGILPSHEYEKKWVPSTTVTEKCLLSELHATNYDFFYDAMDKGCLIWPEQVPVYIKSAQRNQGKDPLIFKTLSESLTSESFWSNLVAYNAQETSNTVEVFSSRTASLVKRIFASVPNEKLLDTALPLIQQLSTKLDHASSQRAAAELMAGVIRGSKHWTDELKNNLWQKIIPLFSSVMNKSSSESLAYWVDAIKFICSRQDPKRNLPLLRILLYPELDPKSSSFFTEAKKLHIVRSVLSCYSWRISPIWLSSFLELLIPYLGTPYQQIRDFVGQLTNQCYQLYARPWIALPPQTVLFVSPRVDLSTINTHFINTHFASLVTKVALFKRENLNSEYFAGCKTILSLYLSHLMSTYTCFRQDMLPDFLKLVLPMRDQSDVDLQEMGLQICRLYSSVVYNPTSARHLLNAIQTALKDYQLEWQPKLRILSMIQVLFFRNLFLFDATEIKQLVDTCVDLLYDPQIEVRQLAAITFSGMIRCNQREIIQQLRVQFYQHLTKSKKEAGVELHGTLLGLSALVLAFPYEIKEWIPDTMVTLAKYAHHNSFIGVFLLI